MLVNFTLNVVLAIISASVGAVGLGVSINQLRRGFNYRFYWWTGFAWIFNAICYISLTIGLLEHIITFIQVYLSLALASSFCVLIQMDTLKREQAEPVKL